MEPEPRQRPHLRGFLLDLLFGTSGNNNNNSSAPLPTIPPVEAVPPVSISSSSSSSTNSNEPTFWRTLPTYNELVNILTALKGFTLPLPVTPEDTALLASLHHLCYYFIGGTSYTPVTFSLSREDTTVHPDLTAQYRNLPPRQDLTELLKRIVEGTLESNNNNNNSETSRSQKGGRALLMAFYPHIMVLIQALMMHLYVYGLMPDDKNAGTMHQWYSVLGNLDALRIILVHACEQGIIDLGDAPRFWKDFIKQNVDEIQRCLSNVHRAESFAVMLKSQLTMRDQAMDELRKQYDPSALQLEMVQGQRACAFEALRNVTSVLSVLHNASALVARNNNGPATSSSTATSSSPSRITF